MADRIEIIRKTIEEIPYVEEIYSLEQRELFVEGKFKVSFDGLSESLDFEIEISPAYPLKSYDSESIIFRNSDLRDYRHVMGGGEICVHTSHNLDLKSKLIIDFNSLKNWILKYYINSEEETHYEHIIVNERQAHNLYYSYLFTDVNIEFQKGDFGQVNLFLLSNSIYKRKNCKNYLVKEFFLNNGEKAATKFSNAYLKNKSTHSGAFVFIEDAPATYNKFVFQNWSELKDYLPSDFLKNLHEFQKNSIKRFRGVFYPVFIGYRIEGNEIHWQVAMIEIGNFPIKGVPEKVNDKKTGKWKTETEDQKIIWSLSRNTSYRYFFGRGTLSEKFTSKKILIIGIGAIGTMLAKTLVRGGCKSIDLADHDIKEPENVCRSEYLFNLGIGDKGEELQRILTAISPFVELDLVNKDYFQLIVKALYNKKEYKMEFENILNKYDIIFDCTTDNDLMYILDSMSLKGDLINISITNHSKEFVCAIGSNIYPFVLNQFENVLDNDVEDLYNPTGCWNPTFKASYNDINSYVQMAIKHINVLYERELPKNNFIIKTDESYPFVQRVIEF